MPVLAWPIQVKSQKPCRQRQLRWLQNNAGGDCGLMTAGAGLIALEPPPVKLTMVLTIAAGAAEAIRPPRLLQAELTLRFRVVQLQELDALGAITQAVHTHHSRSREGRLRIQLGNQDSFFLYRL